MRKLPLQERLSRVSKARQPSAIREITDALWAGRETAPADFVELGHGDPHASLFPWESAVFRLRDGSELAIDPAIMNEALQYGPSAGYPPLVEIYSRLQLRLHGGTKNCILSRPGQWGVLPVSGAMDGLSKSFEMFLNEGDTYLVEIPAYSGVYAALGPLGGRAICCEVDEHGLNPKNIRLKLERALAKGWPSPKFLYTCPTATNPAGMTTTAERRRQIYQLACEYDFYIIEDDPYYFIRFNDDVFKDMPSYLSLDTEGRVIRVDSFSKSISAGLRLGAVTASNDIIQQLGLHMQTSQMHPSQMSQALVSQLLNQWGLDKFLEHTKKVAAFYRTQMKLMCAAVDRHLAGVVEYTIPYGGLFLWLRIPCLEDTKPLVLCRAAAKKIMFVHGTAFQPNFAEADQIPKGGYKQYIRASYSLVNAQQMDLAFKRLREAIDEELLSLSMSEVDLGVTPISGNCGNNNSQVDDEDDDGNANYEQEIEQESEMGNCRTN